MVNGRRICVENQCIRRKETTKTGNPITLLIFPAPGAFIMQYLFYPCLPATSLIAICCFSEKVT